MSHTFTHCMYEGCDVDGIWVDKNGMRIEKRKIYVFCHLSISLHLISITIGGE